jgi:hypothetical protein
LHLSCLSATSALSLVVFIIYFIIVVLGVHCDIYQSSYTVSELNSPLHHSPLSSFPLFLESCQQTSFFHLHRWVYNFFIIAFLGL